MMSQVNGLAIHEQITGKVLLAPTCRHSYVDLLDAFDGHRHPGTLKLEELERVPVSLTPLILRPDGGRQVEDVACRI